MTATGSEVLDLGNGTTTPARVVVHLRPDGTIEVENGGAAAIWCNLHRKYLKVVSGDTGHEQVTEGLFANVELFADAGDGQC